MGERTEALMRIVVAIIAGMILSVWKVMVQIVVLIHWIAITFTGKRGKTGWLCKYLEHAGL